MSEHPFQPVGFDYIRMYHTFIGISYFAYRQKEPFKYVEVATTLLSCLLAFLFTFPCLFRCTHNVTKLFNEGFSLELLSVIVIYIDLYHACVSCLLVAWRSGRLRYFFIRAQDYSSLFKTDLTSSQRQRLLIVSFKLVAINVLHMVAEILLLQMLVPHKVGTMKSASNNATSTEDFGTPKIHISENVFNVALTILKVLQAGQSKAVATILVFIMEYLAILIEKLEMRFDHFVYIDSTTRSVEVAKVAFVELQSLIKCANEVFSHATYDVLFAEIIICLLGILEVTIGIKTKNMSSDVYHELFNLFVSCFTLWMCCSYGQKVQDGVDEVVESIRYINGERFNDYDFKSYSVLISISNGDVLKTFTAGHYFYLNKRAFFTITLSGLIMFLLLLGRTSVTLVSKAALQRVCKRMNVLTPNEVLHEANLSGEGAEALVKMSLQNERRIKNTAKCYV